jgi:hypothetical protein
VAHYSADCFRWGIYVKALVLGLGKGGMTMVDTSDHGAHDRDDLRCAVEMIEELVSVMRSSRKWRNGLASALSVRGGGRG